jgi:hypothetical protein
MDNDCKTEEELLLMKESVEKYLLMNDYENAFTLFLIHVGRLNSIDDRDDFIIYFKNYFRNKLFLEKK